MDTHQLLASIALLVEMPHLGLLRGQVGTVVEVLSDSMVLIEFADLDGQTTALEAISMDQLLTLHHTHAEQVA